LDLKENIGVSGTWRFIWRDENGNVIETREEHNLITQSGLNALAAIFVGEIPVNNAIYLAVGTGTTAAASGNTKLEGEVFRKAIAVKTRELNELRFRFFFTPGEANGDWSEQGVFLAATEITDSGQILNRILPPGGISKVSRNTLTVEIRIPLTAVT